MQFSQSTTRCERGAKKAYFKLPVKRYGILCLIAITGRFIVGQKRFRLYIDMGNMRKRIFDALFLMLLFLFRTICAEKRSRRMTENTGTQALYAILRALAPFRRGRRHTSFNLNYMRRYLIACRCARNENSHIFISSDAAALARKAVYIEFYILIFTE